MSAPPRLHVVTATASPLAVVLRRGPSREVAALGWDRRTGALTPGQWLRGRIYEHRSDLSPDGRHFVCFAGKGGRWWTAASRAPWLRAILFRPQDSTWHGGGAFDAEGRLWLNGSRLQPGECRELRPAPPDAFPHSTDGFHMGDLYAAMQVRRGWRHVGGRGYGAVLERDLPGGGRIELRFALHARNRSIVSNRYARLFPSGARVEEPDWEWADLWSDRLQFAAAGALWERPAKAAGGEARRVHDLSDLAFEPVAAPYADEVPAVPRPEEARP